LPGEKIIEWRWARQFGVAQVSIREALNILTTEGFVTKGHGRSARVLKLGDPEIIQIYQLRGALEGLAARLVVEHKLPLDDLEAALAEMQHAAQQNDRREWWIESNNFIFASFGHQPESNHPVVLFHPDPGPSQEPGCQSVGTPAAQSSQNCPCNAYGTPKLGRASGGSRNQSLSRIRTASVGPLAGISFDWFSCRVPQANPFLHLISFSFCRFDCASNLFEQGEGLR
jgi:hypothetical protein